MSGLLNDPEWDYYGENVKAIASGVLSVRSHLDGMTRIQEITQHPWLAKHVRHVEIYFGEYNRTKFRHELYRSETQIWLKNCYAEPDQIPGIATDNCCLKRSAHFHSWNHLMGHAQSTSTLDCPRMCVIFV